MRSPADCIFLEGLTFYGYHGVNAEERELGQRFEVDVRVYLDLGAAGRSDSIGDTVSYTDIYRVVQSTVEKESYYLLEAVAEALAKRLLTSFSVTAVHIRMKKPSPPVHGAVTGSAGVEIYREKAVQ